MAARVFAVPRHLPIPTFDRIMGGIQADILAFKFAPVRKSLVGVIPVTGIGKRQSFTCIVKVATNASAFLMQVPRNGPGMAQVNLGVTLNKRG